MTNTFAKPYYVWSPQIYDLFVVLSYEILSRNANTRFFGLGNSPSYVVYGMDRLSQRSDILTEVGYVPFSEHYFRGPDYISDEERQRPSLVYDLDLGSTQYYDAKKYRTEYRQFLTGLDLHPQHIVSLFEEKGQKTAILDNVQEGTSFMSFIHFTNVWARELGISATAFDKATKYIAITTDPFPNVLAVPELNLHVAIETHHIRDDVWSAMIGNVSRDTDRFVPSYPPRAWGRPPKLVPRTNAAKITEIKEGIDSAIEKLFAKRPDLQGLTLEQIARKPNPWS